jgi:hypothetical protein
MGKGEQVSNWTLVVSSRHHVDGFLAEANRLRALLDAVSDAAKVQYGRPLTWRGQRTAAEQWADPAAIATLMESWQLADDAGKTMKGGGATGVVQGYEAGAQKAMVNAMWSAGGDGDWPFTCSLRFYGGEPLQEYPVEWLVTLLNTASAAVLADEATIETGQLAGKLMDARLDNRVGVLTLFPHKIDRSALPGSVTVHAGPAQQPHAIVVVADLKRSIDNPAAMVDDLLLVDDLLATAR